MLCPHGNCVCLHWTCTSVSLSSVTHGLVKIPHPPESSSLKQSFSASNRTLLHTFSLEYFSDLTIICKSRAYIKINFVCDTKFREMLKIFIYIYPCLRLKSFFFSLNYLSNFTETYNPHCVCDV